GEDLQPRPVPGRAQAARPPHRPAGASARPGTASGHAGAASAGPEPDRTGHAARAPGPHRPRRAPPGPAAPGSFVPPLRPDERRLAHPPGLSLRAPPDGAGGTPPQVTRT